FARYEANKKHMQKVIRNHRRAAYNVASSEYVGLSVIPAGIDAKECPPDLLVAAQKTWDLAMELGDKHGYRNAQVTVVAPTGTIGLVMGCDTTGIEPDFALVKFKKLAGGGYFKIINTSLPPALKRLGYTEKQIDEIIHYCIGHATLEGSPAVSFDDLRKKGMPDVSIEKIREALTSAFTIQSAFNPGVIGKEVLEKSLKLESADIQAPGFNLLSVLGFTGEQIDKASRFACGTMTIEGAPHLKTEHYAVFDTAGKSGAHGTRILSWQAHVDMMAQVQPFISGAISKTINMPNEATVSEIRDAHWMCWEKMIKAVAIYRDGSKLSQPLSSLEPGTDSLRDALLALAKKSGSPAAQAATQPAGQPVIPMTQQRKKRSTLPNRRNGYTQKAKIGGHSIFIRTGEYEDGSLGEIFLDMHKEGAAFRSLLNNFAIAISLGLQYGVPLEEYVDAFTFTRFEPNGMVMGHQNIKMTTSVIDFIFRDLAFSYLRRADLVQVKPDDLIATTTMNDLANKAGQDGRSGQNSTGQPEQNPGLVARSIGYEGDPCPECGHFTLVRNGTCLKCETCGSTTGCS
ncbi:MAG: vitamin B12-dependent ribonucleotide reductase, partial [Spirochaetaceae bacterium]